MNSYAGRFAQHYDLIYADKPYKAEASFIHECLQEFSIRPPRTLLELACGTGEHAFSLEEFGYKIIATDNSEEMLGRARSKAKERDSKIDFRKQDMRELHLPDAHFDAVYCMFDSIGYVETNEALEQVFQGVNTSLNLEGLFIFEFWHAAAMVSLYDPQRVIRVQSPEGELLRISETSLDIERQLAEVTYTFYEFPRNGSYVKYREVHRNRYFLVQEMSAWLSRFGFKPLRWCAGFDAAKEIDPRTWHIVAVAQKIRA